MRRILAIAIALLAVVAVVSRPLWLQPLEVPEPSVSEAARLGIGVPGFTEVPVDHSHVYAGKGALPFAGGALIDVDGDGREEVFIAGGAGQDDALLVFRGGRFVDVIGRTGLSRSMASYGALSVDVEGDGDVDLFVARQDGLYLHLNDGKGRFSGEKLPLALEPNAVPVSLAAADVNRDGRVDLYVGTSIDARDFRTSVFNDPAQATANLLLLGQADGGFADGTAQSGLGLRRNTFASAFVDLDGDGWQDLAVAGNTGRVQIFRNAGGGRFERAAMPTGFGYWMSLAVADYDGDGDMDIFASNVGNAIPRFLLRGDLRAEQPLELDWALLRNDGEFTFTNVSREAGLDRLEFGWGAAFADFNLDGRPDLVVAENYIKWPAHRWDPAPGRLLLQDGRGGFRPVTRAAGVENLYFGQAPLVADFNDDGFPDLLYVNLDGPARAFFSRGTDNRYLKVRLKDNVRALGARVRVTRADGSLLVGEGVAGAGYLSDQSPVLTFGLGPGRAPASVEIVWPGGSLSQFAEVAPGTTVDAD